MTLLLLTLALPADAEPVLDLSAASCPGPIEVSITDVTPGGRVVIIGGSALGADPVPFGRCVGASTRLTAPEFVASVVDRDGDGVVTATPGVGADWCDMYLEVVDLDSCSLSSVGVTDGADGVCLPDVSVPESGLPLGLFAPAYATIELEGVLRGDALLDGVDPSGGAVPGALTVEFLDGRGEALCQVRYDGADLMPADPALWLAFGEVPEVGWSVDPDALGWTNCARLDAGIYGTIDPRRLLHPSDDPLGFGLGTLTPEVESLLHDGVVSAGGDWSADWEPFVFGAYIVVDGIVAATGHALTYGHTCGAPDDVALPVPALPVGDRYIRTGTEYLLVVD